MEGRARKRVYDTPHHAHALTFSTYRRRPHLLLPGVAEIVLEHLEVARRKLHFEVWAYVVMPEHVHVVLHPLNKVYSMATINKAIKSPSAQAIFDRYPHLRTECQVGPNEFRFWQAGGGYDRNLFTAHVAWMEIHYVHDNPVKRGLCDDPADWPWSSFGYYRGLETPIKVDGCTWSVY